jgi:hypothetical protein
MTDFNIDPPTAMLGAIRAVDEMSIIYRVHFTLLNQQIKEHCLN